MEPGTTADTRSAERQPEKRSFRWLEENRRRIVDFVGIVLFLAGIAFVATAMVNGQLMKLGAGDLVSAGSVLSAAGGVLVGLGSRTRSITRE